MVMVWRALQSAKHIPLDQKVGETDFRYWQAFLKDLSDEELRAGLNAVSDFDDYLTVGRFKKMCRPEKQPGYYNPYQLPKLTNTGTPTPKAEAKRRLAAILEGF
jgi:hypothetical protein